MKSSEKLFVLAVLLAAPAGVRAGFVSYTDEAEWRAAASLVGTGLVHEIDFETLPDGSPSVAFTPITPEFNYTDEGVTFSSPFPILEIEGDPGFFGLAAVNPDTSARNWIIGHLDPMALAVGIVFPGHTTLSVYDPSAALIAELSGGGFGFGNFLGVVSDVPIASMTQDRGSAFEDSESFLFAQVPEPSTLLLLGTSAVTLFASRRPRRAGPGSARKLRRRCNGKRSFPWAIAVATLWGFPGTSALAQSQTWSTDADFDAGFPINSDGIPDATDGSLAIRTTPETLPYIWVACSARGTIVRIATSTFDPFTQQTVDRGQVLGEYWSSPDACRPQSSTQGPSRTTVDFDGDVWAGNRHDASVGGVFRGHVVKVGAGFAFQWKDRDNDTVLDTSTGLGDLKPWADSGDGECSAGDLAQAQDELIQLYQAVGATGVRTVAVDRENHVWVGGIGNRQHALLDGRTGGLRDWTEDGFVDGFQVIGCQEDPFGEWGGYGGVVDRNGVLWSASGAEGSDTQLLRVEPPDVLATRCINVLNSYGLAVDTVGFVWNTDFDLTGEVWRIDPLPPFQRLNFVTSGNRPRGVAVTPVDGHVWIVNSVTDKVVRLDASGAFREVIDLVFSSANGDEPTGVAVDHDGFVWVTNLGSHDVMVIEPRSQCSITAQECRIDSECPPGETCLYNSSVVDRIDLNDVDPVQPGVQMHSLGNCGPYNYSDMTGLSLMWTIAPAGTWSAVYDSGQSGTSWGTVSWVADLSGHADNEIHVQARVAEVETDLGKEIYVDVQNTVPFTCQLCPESLQDCDLFEGRYLQVRVQLNAMSHDPQTWPTLQSITVAPNATITDCNENQIPTSANSIATATRSRTSARCRRSARPAPTATGTEFLMNARIATRTDSRTNATL